MNANNDLTLLMDELADNWTEPTLEILKSASIRQVSVNMELDTWQAVQEVLHSELRWHRAFRFSTLMSLGALREQVLFQAALQVAQKFEPDSVSYEFESRLRRAAGDRRSTQAERCLYAKIVRQPELRAAFKPPSRSDFTPRLRVSALHG